MSAEAQVYIRMIRNLNAPIFTTNYTETISEYADPGQYVVRVRAVDADPTTSPSGQLMYELVDGPTQGAIDYFTIGDGNGDPGLITLNRTLRAFPSNNMFFRVRAADKGEPPKSAIAYVNVRYVMP